MKAFLFASTAVFTPADTGQSTRPRVKARVDKSVATNHAVNDDQRPSVRRGRAHSVRRSESDAADDGHAREAANQKKNAARRARRDRLSNVLADHPLRLYRPTRLAALLDVNEATIWRWRKQGRLPEPVTVAGVTGWTHDQIASLLKVEASSGVEVPR